MKILSLLPIEKTDTLNNVQAELAAVAEKIATTPRDQLLTELLDKAVSFGLKVIAALFIYTIGIWLIRKSSSVSFDL